MAPHKWEKAPEVHKTAFHAALPDHPSVENRTMFGYPCAFVNGNMFCGLHEANICVRLGEAGATERIVAGDAKRFAPMAGRTMKEYVSIPRADCSDPRRLRPWLASGLRYALTLAPKATKVPRKATADAPVVRRKTGA